MSTREQIREELANKIYGIRMHLDNKTREEQADDILSYLDSKGLVFKVERELPENPYGGEDGTSLYFADLLQDGILTQVESLVKNE